GGDRRDLDLVVELRVRDRDRGLARERLDEPDVVGTEAGAVDLVDDLDHTEERASMQERHADHGARDEARPARERRIVTRIGRDVVDVHGLPVTRYPAGNALTAAQPHAVDDAGTEHAR